MQLENRVQEKDKEIGSLKEQNGLLLKENMEHKVTSQKLNDQQNSRVVQVAGLESEIKELNFLLND